MGRALAPVLLLLAVLTLTGPALAAVTLTEAEKRHLLDHPVVTMCVDPDWEPFEKLNDKGEHEGIAADLARLVAERTGLEFAVVSTRDWDESLEASRQGRCKVLSFLNRTPAREKWLLFTEPIFSDPNVLITREEHPFISDPAELSEETIVFPRGTAMEERVRKDYPGLRIRITETEAEALDMVSNRKADMTMRSLIVAAYTIKKEGLFNLKIAGQIPAYTNHLRMGVAGDDAVLLSILNKGIASITPQERARIVNNHVAIQVRSGVDKALVLRLVGVFAVLLTLVLVWIWRLNRHNEELRRVSWTDTLTGLPNRTRLNLTFASELERSRRFGHPMSIIMLDIDHFKRINDEFGHLMGDRILAAVAATARANVRSFDTIGRWGGEEFLIICPETTLSEAMCVAERIRRAVGESVYASGRRHTLSAGAASLEPDDDADALLRRADAALYRAKADGRDRACCAPACPA